MTRKYGLRALLIYAWVALLGLFCAAESQAATNEGQAKANELLGRTFVVSGNLWYAAQKSGDGWQLIQLRNARPNFTVPSIDETARLNGVTDRFVVYVTCDQYRVRSGQWSEWVTGTPGAGQLVVAMSGGLLSYWSANGEKKNGGWSIRTGLGSHELSGERTLVETLINNPDREAAVPQRRDLSLAETKQAAEAGDAEAQYRFAKTYGAGGADWNRWMNAAAAQGFGAAEDDLAWTMNWARFGTASNPKLAESILRMHAAEMRRALILASSAADKGFEHSRQLLAMAYANGTLVGKDSVEAYKWYRLLKNAERYPSNRSPNDDLVKTMSMDEVQAGEARAANYQPGSTPGQVRNALIIPQLKLSGLASNGKDHIAIVNGTRLTAGTRAELNIAGVSVAVECLSVDAKSVAIRFVQDGTRVVLKPGAAAVIVR